MSTDGQFEKIVQTNSFLTTVACDAREECKIHKAAVSVSKMLLKLDKHETRQFSDEDPVLKKRKFAKNLKLDTIRLQILEEDCVDIAPRLKRFIKGDAEECCSSSVVSS